MAEDKKATNYLSSLGQLLVVFVGTTVAILAGYAGFVVVPGRTNIGAVNVLLVLLLGFAGLFVSKRIVSSMISRYNVAEVSVSGPILRQSPGFMAPSPTSTSADDVVEQIERADEDPNSEALILKLNTPGGQVVPSDDIRRAVEEFDGPTVGYATDTCASGGYWIASACDKIYARDTSLVGSIGVIGSRVNAKEFADKVGLSYERLAAGEFKDAGSPLKEMSEDEREYLQSLIDGYYERFVERVTAERELTEDEVRDTEARVYLGDEALEIGLVDEIGTHDDVEDEIEEKIGKEPRVKEFEPHRGLKEQFRSGSESVAYSLGAGVASVVKDDDFEFRIQR